MNSHHLEPLGVYLPSKGIWAYEEPLQCISQHQRDFSKKARRLGKEEELRHGHNSEGRARTWVLTDTPRAGPQTDLKPFFLPLASYLPFHFPTYLL